MKRIWAIGLLALALVGCGTTTSPYTPPPAPEYFIDFESFSVSRYDTATMVIRNFISDYEGHATVYAFCKEAGYPSLRTDLKTSGQVYIGMEPQNLYLSFYNGFSYFTDNTVSCSFTAKIGEYEWIDYYDR